MSSSSLTVPVKKNIIGIEVSDASEKEILEYIVKSIEQKDTPYYIVTPNPEIVVYATKHSVFATTLNQARVALCDGIGMKITAWMLGISLAGRVSGSDLLEKLCKEVAKKPITVGFLGGRGGVAVATAERLVARYPGLQVAYAADEWEDGGFVLKEESGIRNHLPAISYRFRRLQAGESRKDRILNSQLSILNSVDILFVAFGFPKQEEWMAKHIDKIPVGVMMGVGGAFDYISGRVPRAPVFVRGIGLEWLFRLIVQPWRIRRQLALIEFVILVIKEKLVKRVS